MDVHQTTTVDLIGVVTAVGAVKDVTLKNGTSKPKREYTIVDNSGEHGHSINLTVWGDNAVVELYRSGQVVALKNVKINKYKDNKTVSEGYSS